MKLATRLRDALPSMSVLNLLLSLPWQELGPIVWQNAQAICAWLTGQGMYEVSKYASKLDLLDEKGKRARFQKCQTVRYLQNDIIAYQDRLWSDGMAPLHYKVSPGRVVDRYRPGQTTILLISLRGQRAKGDEETFRMQWQIRDGFCRKQELWQTTFYFRTHSATITVTFPQGRPPTEFWGAQQSTQKRYEIPLSSKEQLEDGRWMLSWRIDRPKTHESYNLHWRW